MGLTVRKVSNVIPVECVKGFKFRIQISVFHGCQRALSIRTQIRDTFYA